VQLLIVEDTWDNSKGEECVGLSSGYCAKLIEKGSQTALSSGTVAVASLVRSPVLKLPKDPRKPVVMAGMGTGLAPFRAFIEERASMKKTGQSIGNMRLYFGARHKKGEFLYQDELEAYERQGFLKLRCAWSRDQKQKIYVQTLIAEDDTAIWEALRPEAGGSFYICGPIAPLPDIKKAITKIFEAHGLDGKYLEEMEATGRFATEVY
jgi:sulfite reductase alpha subunit-like flavoprotein